MQQCRCGAEGCRGAIGNNKKIEVAAAPKRRGGGGAARFVMADQTSREADFRGLASRFLLPYWELIIMWPLLWRERSFLWDGRVMLVRNLAAVYARELGNQIARRNFTPQAMGLVRVGRSARRSLDHVLERLWEKNGGRLPEKENVIDVQGPPREKGAGKTLFELKAGGRFESENK